MRYFFTILLTLMILARAYAQDALYYRAPMIQTLRAYVCGDETSYPVIELDGDDRIMIEFDCLTDNIPDLEYRVVHCDRNGTPSDLLPAEYIDGFNVNPVTGYATSTNTTVNYVNFRICLPNDNVRMLLSGRYVVSVAVAGTDSVVARTSFFVYEQIVGINAEIVKPQTSIDGRYAQDVRLSVDYSDLTVSNVFDELNVCILQNGCPYTARTDLKPRQIVGYQLIYSYAGDMLVQGGNEFRRLDARYVKQSPINYNTVDYIGGYFHITTPADESRAFKPYFTEQDQNGQYIVYAYTPNNAFDDYHRSADYTYVHPTLTTEPVLDGDVFVCGAFNNWQLDSANMMHYNFQAKRYEADLFLKQGVYDYLYVCRSYYNGKVDMERFEGSHSETSNKYLFFVFFRPSTADYEQLVGSVCIDN